MAQHEHYYFPIDPATLRVRAGLAADDDSRDNEITLAARLSQEMLEAYLDRELTFGKRVEFFTHDRGPTLTLAAYPVDGDVIVRGVDDSAIPDSFHVARSTGLVQLDWINGTHEIEVEYHGGFELPPAAIGTAILVGFDYVWANVINAAGMVQGAGAIKSLSVPDVGTVSFFDGSGASGDGGGDGAPAAFGAMSDLLAPYRRRWV
jgi:hypothetical protein